MLPQVWVGSVTEITINDLRAEDSDTLPGGLEFIVTPPSNGHLALKSAPSRHILNFTQDHIQTGQLVFVHSGEQKSIYTVFLSTFTLTIESGTNVGITAQFSWCWLCSCAGALSGGFHFQVNDGVNFAPRQIFSTTAHSLVLTLQRNHPMEVYPGGLTLWTCTKSAKEFLKQAFFCSSTVSTCDFKIQTLINMGIWYLNSPAPWEDLLDRKTCINIKCIYFISLNV